MKKEFENNEVSLEMALKNLCYAATSTLEMIKDGSLEEDMKRTMPFLMESYFKEIATGLDYESTLLKEREERFAKIRKCNERIKELENSLANTISTTGIKEKMREISDKVYDWWTEVGFNHVSEAKYTDSGIYQSQLVCRVNAEAKEGFQKKGFIFADGLGRDYEHCLIDTEYNRLLLSSLIKKRFPSTKIYSFENRICFSKKSDIDVFIVRAVNFGITNLEDIMD